MKKVLLIIRHPVGGIRTFINYVYSQWPDKDHEFHIVLPKSPEAETLKSALDGKEFIWHIIPPNKLNIFNFSIEVLKVILKNKFSIIHAHGFTSAVSAGIYLPFIKSSSIFTSHDVLNESQFQGIKGAIKKFILTFTLNRFNIIHSVSNDAQENLIKMLNSINRKRCRVIFNGVDSERYFNSVGVSLKDKYNISEDTLLIGFFGRFMSQKGFKYLVDAVDMLNREQRKSIVICFGSGEYIREEKIEIDRRGLSSLFIFHDFVPDTSPFIKGCDVVAVPSLWEACPLLPMEVMISGIPLVASKCIGLREVCDNTPALMCETANAASLIAAIKRIGDEERVKAKEFSNMARTRFSISSTIDEISKLYLELENS
jgi:glycosyltransferase involved in cell wall biosynthesis